MHRIHRKGILSVLGLISSCGGTRREGQLHGAYASTSLLHTGKLVWAAPSSIVHP